MTLTKPGLIDKLSAVSGLTKKESETVIETIFEQITQALVKGDKVELRGFGSFRVRHRNARRGRNPKTGALVSIPRRRVPFFKSADTFGNSWTLARWRSRRTGLNGGHRHDGPNPGHPAATPRPAGVGHDKLTMTFKATGAILALAIGLTAQPYVISAQLDWDKAEHDILRLPPSGFPRLPKSVVTALQAKRCTIPQVFDEDAPHNVITGSFARSGQIDWAVLCSRDSKSSVMVFWGGPVTCPGELAEAEDRIFLQTTGGIGGRDIGYSRQIRAIDRAKIPIAHHAIEDLFVNKASEVLYCNQGQRML